ncbi:hypothetical protein BGZ81_006792 [Podila clonocystis]|nr:hypothetical protein BGZ81_006792 [Podila clonocystis]
MATPPHVIQLLPHISDAIAETLTFADLINCVRVNHEWHKTFSKFLYEDVITFRSKQTRPGGNWDGREYFISPISCLSFARYSHHIRGLTCQSRQLANILLKTPTFDNLIEINFILDENTPSGNCDTIFNPLTELITRSPHLQAVSVENIAFSCEELLQRLLAFVDILDQYPAITCVYFDGSHSSTSETQNAIWKRLWARVPLDSDQHIKTLVMLRPELLTRSNRGPSRGQTWTPRERPMQIQVPETDLWCDRDYAPVGGVSTLGGRGSGGGRWEDEVWSAPRPQTNVIAIVQASHSLHIEHSDGFYTLGQAAILDVLDRCRQHAQGFMIGKMKWRSFWGAFPSFPNLTAVDINYVRHWMDYDNFVATTQTRLASYRLVGYRAYSPRLRLRLANHFDTLVELDMDVRTFTLKDVCNILASTPRLQSIRIPVVAINGSELEELPEWASHSLEKLNFGLYLEGHRSDLDRSSHRLRYYHEGDDDPDLMEESLEAARVIATPFMARINEQRTLRELELSFNHRRRLRRSPIFTLSLDPVVGLPQLSNLKQLERFVVSGLVHRMGKEEMVWIARTWPRLTSIEVPVVHQWKDNDEALSTCRRFFTGEESELQRWCPPRLKVLWTL